MRRAGQKRTVPAFATPTTSPARSLSQQVDDLFPQDGQSVDTALEPSAGEYVASVQDEQQRILQRAIEQRIESRLRGRVRNLVVRVCDGCVVLEGQCSTYYTKQLAQHAALGILEDEHFENSIIVEVAH